MDFGLQGGFAHVIENEQKFPHYFGKVSLHSQAFGVGRDGDEELSDVLHQSKDLIFIEQWRLFWSILSSGSDWRHDGPGAATLEEADPREFWWSEEKSAPVFTVVETIWLYQDWNLCLTGPVNSAPVLHAPWHPTIRNLTYIYESTFF